MYETAPSLSTSFAGNIKNMAEPSFMKAASINFSVNRGLPAWSLGAVRPVKESVDTLIARAKLDIEAPVGVEIRSTYTASSKTASGKIIVKADSAAAAGDYRIALIIKENGVTGPIPNYRQYSDYNSPYDDNYVFPDVVRAEVTANNIWGKKGSLPASLTKGSEYSLDFTYTLPEKYYDIAPKPENIEMIAVVMQFTGTDAKPTGRVLNCSFQPITKQTAASADTEKPAVSVVSPIAGGSLKAGTASDIKWNASDNIGVTAVKLEYSQNGGTSWNAISAGTDNDGSEPWTPSAAGTYKVRVTASDAAGNSGSAESGSFTVTAADGIDTSNLSVNLVKHAEWSTSADLNGSKVDIDTSKTESEESVSAVLTAANAGESSFASVSGSFEKAFSKSTVFKVRYSADQPVWFALLQDPRSEEGISFGYTLPKSADTTVYLPLSAFAQPEWIDPVKEKLTLKLDSISSFGFEALTIPGKTAFTVKELKASNYTIDPTATVDIPGKVPARIQQQGSKLNFTGSLENTIIRVCGFNGRLIAERSIAGISSFDLGTLNLARGAYIVQAAGVDFCSPAMRFTAE